MTTDAEMELSGSECRMLAEFFTIFTNPTRMMIFCALREGPKTVSQLAARAGVSLQNISQHLRVMRDKNAVTTTKEAQHVYYTVMDDRFLSAACLIREALRDALRRRAGDVDALPAAEAGT